MNAIRSLLLALLPLPLCAQTAPTISSIADRSTLESTTTNAIAFSVDDFETPAADLVVSAESSDTTLVPIGNIVLGGSGTSRTVTLTPATGERGTTTITLTVTDSDLMTASSAFLLTVNPLYSLPAETIPDIVMSADSTLTLNFQMGDGAWTPSVTRTNTTLFRSVGTGSTSDLRLQGTGTHRTLRLRPAPGLYGESDVTITITGDPDGPTDTTFKVTVVPRALADNLLGVADRTSTFDVLRNDTQPHAGTSITVQSFTQPANGTLVEGTIPGTLRYTPAGGFTGNDSFTYTTIYNTGDTTSAIGYITVRNHLPIDAKHTDLRMNHADGVWSNEVHADLDFGTPNAGGSSNPTILDFDEALLMANPSSIITLPGTLDTTAFSFLGKGPGEQIWLLPQSQKSGVLWPGINTESIASGTFAAYTPTGDPRATAHAAWVRLEMTGFRIPEEAVFSMYQGGPTVFWDSIDGVNGPDETAHGNNVSDTFWITVGTHAHMNWSFTHPGRYEIDFQSKAFIDQDGTFVEVTSPVNTLHFMVYGDGDPSTTGPLTEAPPLPHDDEASIAGNSGPAVIDVLANDSSSPDPLETLTVTAVTQPFHGSASITDGIVIYQPSAGFAGPDSFTYTVTDEHGGSATATVQITVLPQTLAAWRQLHYGTTENTGDAANDQDPDGDGIANLLEYAFQLDPAASSTHQLPQAALVGGNLEMTFTPPAVVTGISWGAEWSSTMLTDDWHDIPDTGTAPLHLYQLPMDGKERAFIRIRVTEP
jgi:surface-anchored protein